MEGTSFGAPHPTIANLWVMFNNNTSDNLILVGYCNGAPDTTAGVYSHGCLLTRLDSGTGNRSVYENTGTSASPVWTLLGVGTTSTSSSSSSSSSSTVSTSSSSSSS